MHVRGKSGAEFSADSKNVILLALLMRNRFLLNNNILGKPTDYKRTRPRLTDTRTAPRLNVDVTRRAKRQL